MKFIYTILCLILLTQVQATVRRVRAGNTSPGNGSTWAVAYNNLQTAINASASGDELWVAAGTYQRASGQFYTLKNGVSIYGGFNGTEIDLSQRNWRTNVTMLSGNLANVLRNYDLDRTAYLDGFRITGGNSNYGGGMYNDNASPTIVNCTFSGNYASTGGGGIYNYNCNPLFTNCVIAGNNGSFGNNGNGGGIYNDNGYPVFINCVIANNYAGIDGGGMYTYMEAQYTNSRKPTLTNCVIAYNEAGRGAGGGLFGQSTSYVVTNCTIFGNINYLANCGAGIHNYSPTSSQQSNSTITNCIFLAKSGCS